MANLHNQFLKFEQAISLSLAKKKILITSRHALENRIREHFKVHAKLLVPKFYIQGSYKMGTMVMDKKGTCDVDLGVYFLEEPNIQPISLQKNLLAAVRSHTTSRGEHRDKCIRVKYKGDFDIDLPVYYKTPYDEHPFLATKNGWIESDPKELCDWFENCKDKNGQIIRLVKYFKSWSNRRNRKMPSGIAWTVWVVENYRPNCRDDRAFFETAKAIEKNFGGGFVNTVAMNPATPQDNLLKLDFDQRTRFKEVFRYMLEEAEHALQTNSSKKALNIWKQQFGDKFPVI
ncbi:MAG: hypothetical protein FD170_3138 [Bacteroidetes bacterium]|nr:MAG: hypothetical protein FD170_3138 [Bacteroidota bacterium]